MAKKITKLDSVDESFLRGCAEEEGIPVEQVQVCLLCVFFARAEDGPVCRRFPAHVLRYSGDWCGEFADNEKVKK